VLHRDKRQRFETDQSHASFLLQTPAQPMPAGRKLGKEIGSLVTGSRVDLRRCAPTWCPTPTRLAQRVNRNRPRQAWFPPPRRAPGAWALHLASSNRRLRPQATSSTSTGGTVVAPASLSRVTGGRDLKGRELAVHPHDHHGNWASARGDRSWWRAAENEASIPSQSRS
jgi:hypothetical protein